MKVFLSYAHHDEKPARELAQWLKKQGLGVWSDEDFAPGDNLHEKIGKALSQADAMVVLISPQSVESKFVQSEIDFALTQPRFRNRLIPLVLRPTENIPWILEKQQMVVVRPGKRAAAFRQVADQLSAAAG